MTGKLLPDIVAQLLGGVIAGGVLYLIASGKAGFDVAAGFASNGHGEHSPDKYSMFAALAYRSGDDDDVPDHHGLDRQARGPAARRCSALAPGRAPRRTPFGVIVSAAPGEPTVQRENDLP